jgi:hypothetical protein
MVGQDPQLLSSDPRKQSVRTMQYVRSSRVLPSLKFLVFNDKLRCFLPAVFSLELESVRKK